MRGTEAGAKAIRAKVLAEIAAENDPIQAASARVLSPLAELDENDDAGADALFLRKAVEEQLFALISRRAAAEIDVSDVVDALIAIDTRLVQAGAAVPFAGKFAAAAATIAVHAEATAARERLEIELGEAAPIFAVGRKKLCAVSTGPMGRPGGERFADRVLCAVLEGPCVEVRLVLRHAPDDAAWQTAELLIEDLRAQGIRVVIDRAEATFSTGLERRLTSTSPHTDLGTVKS